MSELKPCPFCGGEARRIDIDATKPSVPDAGASYIACGRCYACSPIMFGEKTGLEESWNRRVISTIDPEAIRREYEEKITAAMVDMKTVAKAEMPSAKDVLARLVADTMSMARYYELEASILSAEPAQDDGKEEAEE